MPHGLLTGRHCHTAFCMHQYHVMELELPYGLCRLRGRLVVPWLACCLDVPILGDGSCDSGGDRCVGPVKRTAELYQGGMSPVSAGDIWVCMAVVHCCHMSTAAWCCPGQSLPHSSVCQPWRARSVVAVYDLYYNACQRLTTFLRQPAQCRCPLGFLGCAGCDLGWSSVA